MFNNLDAGDESQRYIGIERAAKEYPVSELSNVFGVSRSDSYAYLKRNDQDWDQAYNTLEKKVYKLSTEATDISRSN